MKQNHLLKKSAIAMVICSAILSAQSQAQSSNAETIADEKNKTQKTELDALVVTGTKLKETVQEAPASLVVIRDASEPATPELKDVLAGIPNVIFTNNTGLPTIRGNDGNGVAEGGGGAVTGGRPRIATYIDGVARSYSFSLDSIVGTWDIDQVEIYRGAQSGTLGRNSIAGAVIVNTEDPNLQQTEYALRGGIRTEDSTYSGAFMANFASDSGEWGLRFSGESVRGDGYITTTVPALVGRDADRIDQDRFRAKFTWEPSQWANFRLRATFDFDTAEQTGSPATVTGNPENYEQNSPSNYSFQDVNNRVLSLRPEWQFSPQWRFEAVLARQKAQNAFPSPTQAGDPDFLDVSADTTEDSFEPRLIFESDTSRSQAVIGAFVFRRDRDEFGAPNSAFEYQANDDVKTNAVFTDMSFEIAEQWDLRLGARWERESQKREFFSPFGLSLQVDETVNVFLPKLGIDYLVNEDMKLGLSYYEGYQPGGGGVSFETFEPYFFEPEYSKSAEFFIRTQWLDNRLTLNANVFSTRYNDQQYFAQGPAGPNDSVILNAAKTRSNGVEIELNWRGNKGLDFFAGIGYLDTKVIEFGDAINNALLNGNELPGAPSLSTNIGVEWRPNQDWRIGGNVQYVSRYFGDIENSPELNGGAYTLANFDVSYQWRYLTFNAYINNAFDRLAFYLRDPVFGDQVLAPRTLGFSVTARF